MNDFEKLIDLQGLEVYDEEIKKYFSTKMQDIPSLVKEETFLKFPVVGNANALYIDTTENRTYRWDADNLKYYCIGADYNNIKLINGQF